MQLQQVLSDGKIESVTLEKQSDTKRSSYVETLQNCLLALGYDIKVDGLFGLGTETAVKSFQKANSLPETGKVDPQTAGKIDEKVQKLIKEQTQKEEEKDYIGPE